jgi:hypothetical protein
VKKGSVNKPRCNMRAEDEDGETSKVYGVNEDGDEEIVYL